MNLVEQQRNDIDLSQHELYQVEECLAMGFRSSKEIGDRLPNFNPTEISKAIDFIANLYRVRVNNQDINDAKAELLLKAEHSDKKIWECFENMQTSKERLSAIRLSLTAQSRISRLLGIEKDALINIDNSTRKIIVNMTDKDEKTKEGLKQVLELQKKLGLQT